MIKGIRVMLLTIDEGGVPPNIKPLLVSIVSAIGQGNWGEVTHNLGTAQEMEEAQGILEEAEAAVHEAKQAGWDLVKEVEKFCSSTGVAEVSMALKKACKAGRASTELLEQIEQAGRGFDIAVKKLSTYANGKLKDFEN